MWILFECGFSVISLLVYFKRNRFPVEIVNERWKKSEQNVSLYFFSSLYNKFMCLKFPN